MDSVLFFIWIVTVSIAGYILSVLSLNSDKKKWQHHGRVTVIFFQTTGGVGVPYGK